mgnify:CR=1 FL=1
MRDVLCCFDRTQHSICKSKNRIPVALIQDLKSRRLPVRCIFQQPFVCFLVRQSKRSIL